MKHSTENLVLGAPRFESGAPAPGGNPHGLWPAALLESPQQVLARAGGHFALILPQAAGGAFAAVDRFATRTLCYREDNGRLMLAERADALAATPDDIDPQALLDYLYFHTIPAPRTLFRGVRRLPAGHFVQERDGRLEVRRYWSPSFSEAGASFEHNRARFRALLEQAVARQLDGAMQGACFLSGGTDSSTVAGLIGQVTGKPAATYSIGFEAEGYDEMTYARIAARHFGTDHHEHYITPADLLRLIPDAAAHLDQPFGNSSLLPAYFCARHARADGVTRLLAGDGGDELFGGNTRYATQRVFSWYQAVPAALRSGVLEPLARSGALDRVVLLRKAMSYVRQAQVPMPDRLQTYNLLSRIGAETMLTREFLSRVDLQAPAAQERAVWAESQGASFVNRMLAFDWRYTLAENDLPKVRSATELAGVTAEYPFLDADVVDFSSQLATSYKLKGLKLRWFFKEALRGFLPDEIIGKKKHGFGLPFGVWAFRHEGLKAMSVDAVRGLGERGIVRRDFVDTLIKHYLPEHPGYYGGMVWVLMMLEQWFRHHAPGYRMQA